ncbi:hypothetical protein L9F63_011265, partial [Diploptera punctata]
VTNNFRCLQDVTTYFRTFHDHTFHLAGSVPRSVTTYFRCHVFPHNTSFTVRILGPTLLLIFGYYLLSVSTGYDRSHVTTYFRLLLIFEFFVPRYGISPKTQVEIADYPHQVTVEYKHMTRCGGAILGPTWVITAAQCISNVSMDDLLVRGGTKMRGVLGDPQEVKKLYTHPNFNQDTLENDIGLIE